MNYAIILASLLITFAMIGFIAILSKRPMRGLWLTFLIIFLGTWAGQLWIMPVGPVTWGISWIPLISIAIICSVLLAAWGPGKKAKADVGEEAGIMLGLFFWIVLFLMLVLIAVGYYRMPAL